MFGSNVIFQINNVWEANKLAKGGIKQKEELTKQHALMKCRKQRSRHYELEDKTRSYPNCFGPLRFVFQVFNKAPKLLLLSIFDSSRNKRHLYKSCQHLRQPDQWALNVDWEKYINPNSGLWMSTQKNTSTRRMGSERRLGKIRQPDQWALNVDSKNYINLTSGLWTSTNKNTWTTRGFKRGVNVMHEALNVASTLRGSERIVNPKRLWTNIYVNPTRL